MRLSQTLRRGVMEFRVISSIGNAIGSGEDPLRHKGEVVSLQAYLRSAAFTRPLTLRHVGTPSRTMPMGAARQWTPYLIGNNSNSKSDGRPRGSTSS